MFPGLQIVLTLHGYFLASEPYGFVVESRCECISKCYFNMTCSSLFYQTSSKTCYLSDAVYIEDDLQVSADMQYLVWKREFYDIFCFETFTWPSTYLVDGCGNGYSWNPKLDLCYNLHTEQRKSWTDAENTCIQEGGHLLKVDNFERNVLMNYFAVKHRVSIWLGGTDVQKEGAWLWTDNSSITSVWWDTERDQPKGRLGQDCLTLHHNSDDPVNKWHDDLCTNGHRYVCQLLVEPTRC